MSLASDEYSAWLALRNREWREVLDNSSPTCREFVESEVPVASGAWCRQAFSRREIAIHAAPELLLRAASIGPNGRLSGLGALHQLVNHPDALTRDDSGRSFRDEVFHIVGTAMHDSIPNSGTTDTMIAQLTALCVRLEEAHSGVEGLVSMGGVLRPSTDQCMLAAAVLEWERTGLPARNFPERGTIAGPDLTLGNRVDMAQDHSLQVAGMLSHLRETTEGRLGAKDGLRETSSLLTMQRYTSERLQSCYRFVAEARKRQCALP